jgi:hypothetical protein
MYRSIEAKFWTDPKIRELSPAHKLLFLYLITNSHTHVSGIYYLPKVLMQHETGLGAAEVERGIDTLSKGYLCAYDETTEVVWVRKMARYQGHGRLMKAAVLDQLKNLHNCSLIKEFLKEYEDWDLAYIYPINTPSIPYRQQEQEQEQEQKDTLSSENPDEARVSISCQELVEGWNTVCAQEGSLPRKTHISDTLKQKIRSRLREHPEHEFWETVLNKCLDSPFLVGEKGSWHATFDWLMKNPENAVKVYEGNYDAVRATKQQRG